ncbi:hypothetical protein TIFTF001_040437 [Ficus carica]|uniref:Expansin-like EG45 domain-containing protein n=1 Tax=Ficus carica TaxID=3494 RepID=A0AA87YTP4_FICCA|nr:hypothetical protein TIFTF001_040437 [Ficus carica]
MCLFFEQPPSALGTLQPEDMMIAAVSDKLWDNKAACERSYLVTCSGPTNQAPQPCYEGNEIVDLCKGCPTAINLSQEAFAKIANINDGKIRIKYEP